MKIAIGLSGGVDSTVAAYLLKQQGHTVIGITMKIWDNTLSGEHLKSACFGPDEEREIEETREICRFLGIPLHEIDLKSEYGQHILNYFKSEYKAGRTPNPCVRCNQIMKFDFLLKKARELSLEFDKFATGHYANIGKDDTTGRYYIEKGADEKKDQSYFLSMLSQNQLKRIMFPLGKMKKPEVKEISKTIGLTLHEKKESQDFYSGNIIDLLDGESETGDIVDKTGKVLGKHTGYHQYTIGQRKGLGVSHSHPLYVTKIDGEKNRITLGTEEELYKSHMEVSGLNWMAIERPASPVRMKVRIRYLHKESPALITPADGDKVRIDFDSPQKAITPGQFAVFYDDTRVAGGGVIERVY
ncbi:MAG: tRNA 2-thiouridine(34) synthase MnmA [Spirochaetales bacterium]|nr:tRNA 2-thiouridine(34) synthase MnmA [Spirochaetales bacterium]